MKLSLTSLLGLALLAAIRLPASDWPRFLGPNANGIAAETGLISEFPKSGPPLIWSKEVGTGYSAPSILGGQLILHHRLTNREVVQAFAASTGAEQWSVGYPTDYTDPYGYNNGPRSTPILTDEFCYTFGAEGKLLCLRRKTGEQVWERNTAKDWTIPPAFFGVGSTPLLENNRLIVMVGGQPNSGIVAFDALSGKTLWESVGQANWQGVKQNGFPQEPQLDWKTWEKQASYSSPVAATIHGERHILCLMRQGLVSLNPTNGSVNFSYFFRSRLNDSVNAMNPVVKDDMILISAAYYRVGATLLRVKPGGREVEEVWKQQGPGKEISLEIHWSTPILHDGSLFAFSGRNEPDARLRCVEFGTGKLRWDRNESWPPHSAEQPPVFGRGSFILADGKLIALGEGGMLGLFRPNPERLEELSRFQVPELSYPCWAAPVLSERRLYLRNERRLVCYNLAQP